MGHRYDFSQLHHIINAINLGSGNLLINALHFQWCSFFSMAFFMGSEEIVPYSIDSAAFYGIEIRCQECTLTLTDAATVAIATAYYIYAFFSCAGCSFIHFISLKASYNCMRKVLLSPSR